MILATDVHYFGKAAVAAGILFDSWSSAAPSAEYNCHITPVADYEPGQFYKRELPCLMALLQQIPTPPDTVIIDGFVTLGQDERPGLGAHLHDAFDGNISVVGVAKTAFRDTPAHAEILRGQSKRPLYVTSKGIPPETARDLVRGMHGTHRIPTILAQVDALCRAEAARIQNR